MVFCCKIMKLFPTFHHFLPLFLKNNHFFLQSPLYILCEAYKGQNELYKNRVFEKMRLQPVPIGSFSVLEGSARQNEKYKFL